MKYKRFVSVFVVLAVLVVAVFGLQTSLAAQTTDTGQENTTAGEDAQNAGAPAAQKGKDEVVYATLGQTGSVDAIYVVNHFSSAAGKSITDHGAYSSVVNLTNTNELSVSGDTVSFTPAEENFYYQGNMDAKDLPWSFSFNYLFDGVGVQPSDIAGKSGKLELAITSAQNKAIDPTFYENYMLQISVTLDTELCSNIEAPDATIASAGKDKTLSFTVLPGSDAAFSLSADVRDFEMAGITVAAVPYSMNMEFPDMDDKLGDLEQLPDAIAELSDGVGELSGGTVDMKDGASQLSGGSAEIRNGLQQLGGNASQIKNGSAQINTALQAIASGLSQNSPGELDLSQLSALPQGLRDLAVGLRALSGGLTQLKDGFSPAYQALDAAIAGIPAANISQQQIAALYAAAADPSNAADTGTVDALVAQYQAAQTVKGTYAQVKAAFDGVGTAIDTTNGHIDTMAGGLESSADEIGTGLSQLSGLSGLSQLTSGISELAANYATFHSGLVQYADGVSALSSNYAAFHNGVVSLADGAGDLSSGVGELYDGTTTLSEEVEDLPDMMQEEIDAMKADYLPADFVPISFTSSKNTDTSFVQFVIQSEGIARPEQTEEPAANEEEPQTFWDRFTALFSGDE